MEVWVWAALLGVAMVLAVGACLVGYYTGTPQRQNHHQRTPVECVCAGDTEKSLAKRFEREGEFGMLVTAPYCDSCKTWKALVDSGNLCQEDLPFPLVHVESTVPSAKQRFPLAADRTKWVPSVVVYRSAGGVPAFVRVVELPASAGASVAFLVSALAGGAGGDGPTSGGSSTRGGS